MGDVEQNQVGQPASVEAQVQAAVRRLDDLETVGIDGSLQVYDDIHRLLSSALDGSTDLPPRAAEADAAQTTFGR